MERGPWWATVDGDAKESDMTEQLSMHTGRRDDTVYGKKQLKK